MKKSTIKSMRISIQIFIFISVFLISINSFLEKKIPFIPSVSTHNICTFGGVSTIYKLITDETYISKIHSSAVILLVITLIVTILFGAIFCGFLCPFGSFQEFIGKISKKIFKKKCNNVVLNKVIRVLGVIKYFILVKLLYETIMVSKLVCDGSDPFYALFNFFTGEVAPSAFIVLLIVIISSLFIERPFCKIACPMGAIISVTSKISIFKINRNKESCINCKKCDNVCPSKIKISEKNKVSDLSCISCYKCLENNVCPVEDTLTLKVIGGAKNEN